MKTSNLIALLFMSFMILFSSNAQTQFSYPMKPGDISVFEKFAMSLFVRAVREMQRTPTGGNFDGNNDTVLVESGNGDYYRISLDSERIVVGSAVFFQNNFLEFAPTNISTLNDTFYLHGSKEDFPCIITARFDTTIFNQKVHAYRMSISLKGDSIIQAVADTFGIIRQSHYYPTSELHFILNSAEISGKKFNRDQIKRSYMPLCIGNIYQRLITLPTTHSYYQTETIIDTISINGIQYFKSSLNNLYREDMNGVFKIDSGSVKEQLICSSDASIGTIFPKGVVTDTTTYYWNGKNHRLFIVHRSMTEYYYSEKWIEGLGMESKGSFNGFDATGDELIYANVCGNIFGNLVSVEKQSQPSSPTIVLDQNSPNPFSSHEQTRIRFTIPNVWTLSDGSFGHAVSLQVFDVLGRKVATLVDGVVDAGEHEVLMNASSLKRGVYFYRLTVGNNFQTKKMIVKQ